MKTLFYDDVLRFLYSSNMFQQLTEQEQVSFLDAFARDEQFAESVAVAVDFQEQLGKLEAAVPEIGHVDISKKFVLKEYAIKEGNVTHFPFGEKVDHAAPLIVILDTSSKLQTYELQAKGLLLPLLELCSQQQRDCVVLANGEALVFPHGQIKQHVALQVHHMSLATGYPLKQHITQAIATFEQYVIKGDAELLFITAGIVSLQAVQVNQLKSMAVELAVIALDTMAFEQNPTSFDKAFFPNGELASIL